MEKRITVSCSTRKFDGDDAVQTELTIDMTNLTEDDILSYAVDAIVVKRQGGWRRGKDPIPTKEVYVVPKPGKRATGEVSLEKAFEKVVKAFDGDIDKAIEFMRAKSNNRT